MLTNIQRLLGIDTEISRQFFDKPDTLLKRALSEKEAERLFYWLHRAGADCRIEKDTDGGSVSKTELLSTTPEVQSPVTFRPADIELHFRTVEPVSSVPRTLQQKIWTQTALLLLYLIAVITLPWIAGYTLWSVLTLLPISIIWPLLSIPLLISLVPFLWLKFLLSKPAEEKILSIDLIPSEQTVLFVFVAEIAQRVRTGYDNKIELTPNIELKTVLEREGSTTPRLRIGLPLLLTLDTRQIAFLVSRELARFRPGQPLSALKLQRKIEEFWLRKLDRPVSGIADLKITLERVPKLETLIKTTWKTAQSILFAISRPALKLIEHLHLIQGEDLDRVALQISGHNLTSECTRYISALKRSSQFAYDRLPADQLYRRLPQNLPLTISIKALRSARDQKPVQSPPAEKQTPDHPKAEVLNLINARTARRYFDFRSEADRLLVGSGALGERLTRLEYKARLADSSSYTDSEKKPEIKRSRPKKIADAERYLSGLIIPGRIFPTREINYYRDYSPEELHHEISLCRQELEANSPVVSELKGQFNRAQHDVITHKFALELIQDGIPFNPESFDLSSAYSHGLSQGLNEAEAKLIRVEKALPGYEVIAARRLAAAIAYAVWHDTEAEASLKQALLLQRGLMLLNEQISVIDRASKRLALLLEFARSYPATPPIDAIGRALRETLEADTQLERLLDRISYPFSSPAITLLQYLAPTLPDTRQGEPAATQYRGQFLVGQLSSLNKDNLDRLVAVAEHVETKLGITAK